MNLLQSGTEPIKFRYRAVNIEHSCQYGKDEEPIHPDKLNLLIDNIIKATEGMEFYGIIKSSVNSYQVDVRDFDLKWVKSMEKAGWERRNFNIQNQPSHIPKIEPDALLEKDNIITAIEIEKANEKTVWFDFIKLLMLIGEGIANFGILVVPKNYAFIRGQWDLFNEARYYRWCLAMFAKVDSDLLSQIGIVGYGQEINISQKWMLLNKFAVKTIKEQARAHFLSIRNSHSH